MTWYWQKKSKEKKIEPKTTPIYEKRIREYLGVPYTYLLQTHRLHEDGSIDEYNWNYNNKCRKLSVGKTKVLNKLITKETKSYDEIKEGMLTYEVKEK
jgi:hypothetical protein